MMIEKSLLKEALAFAVMITVECTNVGQTTIYKAAVTAGLSHNVFIVYSYATSALVLLPLCFCFRTKGLPPLTPILLAKFFCIGALGFGAQYVGYIGIEYSSPTLGSAMSNISPAATFFLAVLLRMETLKIRSWISQVKIVGTLVSILGAIVVVMVKGPVLFDPHHDEHTKMAIQGRTAESDWIFGGGMLALSYLIGSIWYICQAVFVREYPGELVVVFFFNLFACISSLPFCLPSERNPTVWRVPTDVRLWSILYSGVIGTGFGVVVHTWALNVKGPVYVSLFRPLSIAITAVFGVLLLGDSLYLGCVIGSIVISIGFYMMVWGKAIEKTEDEFEVETPPDEQTPLLSNKEQSSPPV